MKRPHSTEIKGKKSSAVFYVVCSFQIKPWLKDAATKARQEVGNLVESRDGVVTPDLPSGSPLPNPVRRGTIPLCPHNKMADGGRLVQSFAGASARYQTSL